MEKLIFLNKIACILHFSSFVAALVVSIIYASKSYLGVIDGLPPYPLLWVDLPFPILTSFFHGIIGFYPKVQKMYVYYITKENRNPFRWIEYSITATLMTWVILQLAGVSNIYLLVFCGIVGNIALQAQGHLQEKIGSKSYIPTLIGWMIFSGQWTIILIHFSYLSSPPWFVTSIIIGMFVFFFMFGYVQISSKSAYEQDMMYLILSFTSKFYLTWNLLIAATTSN